MHDEEPHEIEKEPDSPLPWVLDLKYPHCPSIRDANGNHVNVDFKNNGDAALIIRAVELYRMLGGK